MEVSIIIPFKEAREFLNEAIASAECQSGFVLNKDYEIILQKGDYRLGKNVNDGVAKAKGRFIKILADDDLLTPNCLIDLYTKAVEGFDFVCANAINFEPDGKETLIRSRIPDNLIEFTYENPIHGGTVLYRKENMPAWDETMWTAEEYEVTLRMANMGLSFGYVDSIVHRYRLHDSQKSGFYWETDDQTKLYRFEYIEALQSQYAINKRINKSITLQV
jgi:glycosyltransferase involved in cell wall biosynthesis